MGNEVTMTDGPAPSFCPKCGKGYTVSQVGRVWVCSCGNPVRYEGLPFLHYVSPLEVTPGGAARGAGMTPSEPIIDILSKMKLH